MFARSASGGWVAHVLRGHDPVLELPEVAASLPLAEVYEGAFDPEAPPDEEP